MPRATEPPSFSTLYELQHHFGIPSDGITIQDELLAEHMTHALRQQFNAEEHMASAQHDVARLMRIVEAQHQALVVIHASRAWRIGHGIMTLARKILGRGTARPVFDETEEIYAVYDHWKRSR